MLFYIPQRYWFSSKSQRHWTLLHRWRCCFIYHKGTDFQANHNQENYLCRLYQLFYIPQRYWFSSKSQLSAVDFICTNCCFIYHKGTDFQANHNPTTAPLADVRVVLYTTKVLIFKQITTYPCSNHKSPELFYIPQRYWFSSKSQRNSRDESSHICCFIYHKGTDFQANHNTMAVGMI